MFKIRTGSTRYALILFNWLVIKYPNPGFRRIRNHWKNRISFPSFLHKLPRCLYYTFFYGVASNVSEALVYSFAYNTAKYLSPVFTIGVLNFSWYEGEDEPTQEEIEAVYNSLPEKARTVLASTSCHERAGNNWRKTARGLIPIDYGVDPLRTSWANFLRGNSEELNEKTAKK